MRISGLHNLWRERVCNLLRRKLSAGVVDGAGRGEDELGDGEDGVAVVDEVGEDSGQHLRRMEGRVVKQHNAAGRHMLRYPAKDGVRVIILPVEGALSART